MNTQSFGRATQTQPGSFLGTQLESQPNFNFLDVGATQDAGSFGAFSDFTSFTQVLTPEQFAKEYLELDTEIATSAFNNHI